VLLALVRLLILAGVVPAFLLCVDRVGDHAHAIGQQRQARTCPAGTPWQTAEDCVAEVTAEVVSLSSSVSCTTTSSGGQSCTTDYYADVRFGQRTQTLGVGKDLYRDAERGDPAELRLWQGDVVRLEAAGHTERFLTSTEWASAGWLFLGWMLLGVAWVAVLGLWLFPLLGGWLLLAVPSMTTAYHLLGLNPMGMTGWSVVVVSTVAGVWVMARTRAAL
jgi:hypothetical protein